MTKKRKKFTMGNPLKQSNQLKTKYPEGLSKGYQGAGVDTALTQDRLNRKQSSELRSLKKETSRLNSMANKRIRRMQDKGMSSPALEKWLSEGGEYFSVAGKDWNETQKELGRVRNFVNNKTSSIRGATNVLKNMASNTGIKYNSIADLQREADKFFDLASKTEQYLRMTQDSASAIGYQKIWEAINQYVEEQQTYLDESETDVNALVEQIAGMITQERDNTIINRVIDKDGFIFL